MRQHTASPLLANAETDKETLDNIIKLSIAQTALLKSVLERVLNAISDVEHRLSCSLRIVASTPSIHLRDDYIQRHELQTGCVGFFDTFNDARTQFAWLNNEDYVTKVRAILQNKMREHFLVADLQSIHSNTTDENAKVVYAGIDKHRKKLQHLEDIKAYLEVDMTTRETETMELIKARDALGTLHHTTLKDEDITLLISNARNSIARRNKIIGTLSLWAINIRDYDSPYAYNEVFSQYMPFSSFTLFTNASVSDVSLDKIISEEANLAQQTSEDILSVPRMLELAAAAVTPLKQLREEALS